MELGRDVRGLFVMVVNVIINSILDSGMGYRDEEFYVPALFYADDGNCCWQDRVRRRRV